MTEDEHRERHKKLHRAVAELFADFIDCHPNEPTTLLDLPIWRLMEWSYQQTVSPDDPRSHFVPSEPKRP